VIPPWPSAASSLSKCHPIILYRRAEWRRLAAVKPLSWVGVGLVTVLAMFAQWALGNPYDIGGALGRSLGVLLIPFVVAYLVRGVKGNWDSFARWYFWLVLVFMALSGTQPH
jgi:hypothetical protein